MRQKLPKLPQNTFILPIKNILTATLLYRVPNLAFRLIKRSIEIRLFALAVHIIRRDYEHPIVATLPTLRWVSGRGIDTATPPCAADGVSALITSLFKKASSPAYYSVGAY